MKKIFCAIFLLSCFIFSRAEARQGFAVGVGPVGNIFLIDTTPILEPGVGGHVFFNYRFAEQVAFETTFLISSQNGTNISKGDNGILLLGMPTLDLKYYFLKDDPAWDPYAVLGIGSYWVTEGSVGNATGGLGLGAQMGLGFDYYLSDQFSLGFSGIFRSIGLITDFGTPSSSTALFPFSLMGNVAFHF
ncbi:MAG: outer membrane beta-barrel protein [Deltaproteobacteria bacterium]|nr:MAG: outer membrane beta-barrel protein [Deltaproteobacteria bacterium]